MTHGPRSKYKKIIENFETLKTVIYLALTLDSGFLDFFYIFDNLLTTRFKNSTKQTELSVQTEK